MRTLKTLCYALLALVVILSVVAMQPLCLQLPRQYVDSIVIYCASSSIDAVDNGVLYEVASSVNTYADDILCCDGIVGYSMWVHRYSCSIEQLCDLLEVSVSITYDIADYTHIYGYCATLGTGIVIDMHRINIHIVTTDEYYVIGTPILLGSY